MTGLLYNTESSIKLYTIARRSTMQTPLVHFACIRRRRFYLDLSSLQQEVAQKYRWGSDAKSLLSSTRANRKRKKTEAIRKQVRNVKQAKDKKIENRWAVEKFQVIYASTILYRLFFNYLLLDDAIWFLQESQYENRILLRQGKGTIHLSLYLNKNKTKN